MPVKSYLAHTGPGGGSAASAKIEQIPGCAAWPAGNRDAVIIVTDAISEEEESRTRERLEALEELHSLTLVAAFSASDDLVGIGGKA